MKCANSVLIRKFPNWIGLKLDLDMVLKPELENTQNFGCFDFYVDQNVFCILVFCRGLFQLSKGFYETLKYIQISPRSVSVRGCFQISLLIIKKF